METLSTATELEWLGWTFYAGSAGLVLLGCYALFAARHALRLLLGLFLLESGVNLFLVAVGFRPDAAAPILVGEQAGSMVDPLPQALILTAIVIGVGVLALGLALAVRVAKEEGTLDLAELGRRLAATHTPATAEETLPQSGRTETP
ncbi:MAG: cation:proton antiporter subunit C [Chromatiales bacterium]|nr:cation:proton antiporter subunit C [Chromatiales bacterium]